MWPFLVTKNQFVIPSESLFLATAVRANLMFGQ